jgi:hypothetical protein
MIYFVRRGELRGGREKRRSDSKVLDKVGGILERGKGFPSKSLQGIFGKSSIVGFLIVFIQIGFKFL